MLERRTYLGEVPLAGEYFPGKHEAIVERALFDKVAQVRIANTRGLRTERGRPPLGNHLFTGGFLRCGACGGAMVPRTNSGRTRKDGQEGKRYSVYQCHTEQNAHSCDQPPVPREAIDSAVVWYFEAVVLDAETTLKNLRVARDRERGEVAMLRGQAERQVAAVEASLQKIERDYLATDLPAADYLRLRDGLHDDLRAAQRDAGRLAAREAEVDAATDVIEGDDDLLALLTRTHAAIIGEIRDAGEIESVRAALKTVFDRFVLHREQPELPAQIAAIPYAHPYYLEPVLRAEALLERVPLSAANNPRVGFVR
jgi:hypothetical protein